MHVLWGVVLVGLGLLCWGGQLISWLAPDTAVRLSLTEAEADVEPAVWADLRGEALWDALSLWSLVVAGILLVFESPAWAYFGLAGGGAYVYFAGRGIATRRSMQHSGFRIGAAPNVRVGYTFLAIWGVAGAVTIAAAIAELRT